MDKPFSFEPDKIDLFSTYVSPIDEALFNTSSLAIEHIEIEVYKDSVLLDAEGDGLVLLDFNQSSGTQQLTLSLNNPDYVNVYQNYVVRAIEETQDINQCWTRNTVEFPV